MDPQSQPDPLNPKYAECMRLHSCWPWFFGLGILLILAGAMAIAVPHVMTQTAILVLGFLLVGGGVVQIVNAFVARSWRGFFVHLLAGMLHLLVGGLLIEHPLRAAEGLTLILAVAFLIRGALRIVVTLLGRLPPRGWGVRYRGGTFLPGSSIL